MREVTRGYDDRDRRADAVQRNEVKDRKSKAELDELLNTEDDEDEYLYKIPHRMLSAITKNRR